MSINLSQYLDPVKEKLAPLIEKLEPWLELLKEKLTPLMERLEVLPYYPYSVIGAAVVILLLLIVRGRLSPKKRSPANRSKGAVTGVAVGLASHEEYHGNAPVDNANVMTAPFPTATSTAPMATAPMATAPTATAPEPYGSVADQTHDQVFKACQERFQAIYMDMYIELGLASDFEQFRTEVRNRLKSKETYHAVSELKMDPEGVVLVQMAIVAGNTLQSGASHVGKGQLDVHGRELFAVYRHALNTMLEKSLASQDDVRNKIDFMEKALQELGE